MLPKRRTFTWRLARSSLPTGEVRAQRKMATLATCAICGTTTNDTWRHSLLECNMEKSVWALHDDDASLSIYGDETPDVLLWPFSLNDTLDVVDLWRQNSGCATMAL